MNHLKWPTFFSPQFEFEGLDSDEFDIAPCICQTWSFGLCVGLYVICDFLLRFHGSPQMYVNPCDHSKILGFWDVGMYFLLIFKKPGEVYSAMLCNYINPLLKLGFSEPSTVLFTRKKAICKSRRP